MSTLPSDAASQILARLQSIDDKLDYVVARQRYLEDLVDEMTPVARVAMGAAAESLADFETRGYFAVGKELMTLVDRVVTTYGAGEVKELGDHIVTILDTVRNVTQPGVLAVANDATNVLNHGDEVQPVGMMGVMRATRDDDVQRGMAMALEILRHIGSAASQHEIARAERPARTAAPARTAPASRGAPKSAKPAFKDATPPEETVTWEGVTFTPKGFLVSASDWTPDLAAKMAEGLGVPLTDDHWTVLNWIRDDYAETGASPNVRRVAVGSGVGTKAMYQLFPKTPGRTAAQIAGVPKPVGCV